MAKPRFHRFLIILAGEGGQQILSFLFLNPSAGGFIFLKEFLCWCLLWPQGLPHRGGINVHKNQTRLDSVAHNIKTLKIVVLNWFLYAETAAECRADHFAQIPGSGR